MKKLLCLMLMISLLPFADAFAEDDPELGGSVEGEINGETFVFPLLKTDIDADIQGDLATITVTQTFENPAEEPMNATYLFPLNKDAAVYAMRMEVGDEITEAVIQKKEEAQKTFDTAKREGKAAALLTQHRPNMFTQNIANLMPGLPIKVTISYVQTVPKIDNAYELDIPLVVGPRFQPAGAGVPPVETTDMEEAPKQYSEWELEELPAYPQVSGLDIPDTIDEDRVGITVKLNSGMAITSAESATHHIATAKQDEQHATVTLASGRTIDNRDFVLRYKLAGDATQAGLLAYRDARGGFFSLMLEPPALPSEADILPREMVFVLDCSGSMSGMPMEASKEFMRKALKGLREKDYFRVIRFSDSASEYTTTPQRATRQNVGSAIQYVNQLHGSGGTRMESGIRQALEAKQPDGTVRIVVFLTDGYIGNEASILALIKKEMKDARLYAFGVGTSINRYLLSEMGTIGRGFTRYMDPTENVEDVASELATRLDAPVLTNISIDWGKAGVEAVSPDPIPDLFAGQSVRIQGKYTKPGNHTITVHGQTSEHKATMPIKVELPESSDYSSAAIPLIWARSDITSSMRSYTANALPEEEKQALKEHITQLGLDYALVTQWTSFVATSKTIFNPDAHAVDANVPLPMVKGVTNHAYGNSAAQQHFSGGSAPEPATLAGLAVILAGAGAGARRKHKATRN